MKLADLATGSDWIVWIVFAIFAVLSIILLSGHGSWFISGYNTASNEEKEKYDYKQYNTIKLWHEKTGSVEEIGFDEYLYGVVSAEMPAGLLQGSNHRHNGYESLPAKSQHIQVPGFPIA